jgi:hypothetical protein
MRVPWTESGNATFGFSTLMLQASNAPTFNWTLITFANSYAGNIDVLALFEDFFRGYGFTKQLLSVFELLLDCSSA